MYIRKMRKMYVVTYANRVKLLSKQSSITTGILTQEQRRGLREKRGRGDIKLRLRQQFSRAKISNYAEVSNVGGEGVSNYAYLSNFQGQRYQITLSQQFLRGGSIRLHTCTVAKTLTSAIFKGKDVKLR